MPQRGRGGEASLKITLLYIGRPRDAAANQMAQEYARRIGRFCEFAMRQATGEESLDAHDKAYKILLDPAGRQLTSAELAKIIDRAQNTAVRELVFMVGGAEGFTDATRQKAQMLLSLSRLTLPHELARVILAEQIYRAFAILTRHPYAK